MNKDWFKKRMRIAGQTHESLAQALGRDRAVVSRILNGHQLMKPDQAEVIAEHLEAPLDEVLREAGIFSENAAPVGQPGFAEADVAPFAPEKASGSVAAMVAASVGREGAGVDIWRVKTSAMSLAGYLPGDFMLVDAHKADQCMAGDIVIAQVYDWQIGSATTLLRRWQPPVLVAASTDPKDEKVHVVDGNNVMIKGKVVASWRT